jgi:hypothetical protein
MRFCPGCGLSLQEGGGPKVGSASEGALRFTVPQQQVYPMPYHPMPGMYPVPSTGKRSQAIAGGIILIIAACFAFIGGIYYLVDSWWWTDFWAALAALCFAAFTYALFGAVGLFQRRWRLHSLLSCILLIFTGFLTMLDLEILSVIIIVLASISVSMVAMSWRQVEEMQAVSAMYASMMQQMPTGMPMGMPPQGATPPYAPPTGAPPPAMSGMPVGFDQGATPPPLVPVGDEQVVAYVDEEASD